VETGTCSTVVCDIEWCVGWCISLVCGLKKPELYQNKIYSYFDLCLEDYQYKSVLGCCLYVRKYEVLQIQHWWATDCMLSLTLVFAKSFAVYKLHVYTYHFQTFEANNILCSLHQYYVRHCPLCEEYLVNRLFMWLYSLLVGI
jgi:hypothetical protein